MDRGHLQQRPDGGTISAGSSTLPVPTPSLRSEALLMARQSLWLSGQTPEFQDALLQHAGLRCFLRGETIIALEGVASDLHFLLYGSVEVSVARPTLELATIHVIPARVWFGEHAAISRLASFAEYRARSGCTCVVVPHAAVVALQARSAAFSVALADLLALSLQTQFDLAGSVVDRSVEQRIRNRLLSLAGIASPALAGGQVTLPIRQEELAVITSTSRSSVCKVLSELAQRGVIRLGYGAITVLQPELLAG